MRVFAVLLAATFLVLGTSIAGATGIARVQQDNGSVQVYRDVTIVYTNKTLRITTADKKGTLVITKAACSYVGELQRCYPYQMHLEQNGDHPIDFDRGTVYYNPTGTNLTLPFSSTKIPPNGVIAALKSKVGTYLTIIGTLDRGAKQ